MGLLHAQGSSVSCNTRREEISSAVNPKEQLTDQLTNNKLGKMDSEVQHS